MIHEDVDRIELFVAHHITDLFVALITPMAAAGILLWFDWRLALVALLPLPLAILLQSLMYRGFEKKAAAYYQSLSQMNRQASQLIRSIAALRMLPGATGSGAPLTKSIKSYSRVVDNWIRDASWPFSLLKVSLDISFVVLLPVTAWFTLAGELNVASFVLFMMLGLSLTEPFYNLLMFTGFLNQILQGVKRIEGIQNSPTIKVGRLECGATPAHIQLNKLSFRFPQTRGRCIEGSFPLHKTR